MTPELFAHCGLQFTCFCSQLTEFSLTDPYDETLMRTTEFPLAGEAFRVVRAANNYTCASPRAFLAVTSNSTVDILITPVGVVNLALSVGVVNLASPVGVVNLASPVGVVNLTSPVGVVNLASPVGVVNLTSPVGVVNLASPVDVVNLAPPVGVVNLAPLQLVRCFALTTLWLRRHAESEHLITARISICSS